MTVIEDPSLAQEVIESSYPSVLSFKLSEPAIYMIDWGDGTVTRNFRAAVQETHVYSAPGQYDVITQITGVVNSFQTRVSVLAKRERERTQYRWAGPLLKMGSLNSYNEAATDPRSPYFVQLAEDGAEDSRVIALPSGLVVEPGDTIQISQTGKRFSGGKVAAVLTTDPKVVRVELDFQLTDSYTAGAQVQLVNRPSSYAKTRVSVGSLVSFIRGTDDALVHDSFGILLATSPGERVGRPDLGFRGREVAFEPNDAVAASMIQAYAVEAAATYERRLRIRGVRTSRRENELRLQIDLQFTTGLEAVFDHTISLSQE